MKRKASITPPNHSGNGFLYATIAVVMVAILALGGFIFMEKSKGNSWDSPGDTGIDNLSVEYTSEGRNQGEYATFYTNKDARHVISVFSDPRCPVCGQFEREHGKTMKTLLERGDTAVRVHLLSFLDERTNSDYSKTISSVFKLLVEHESANVAWKFYEAMWENQPTERNSDKIPNNDELAMTVHNIGASDETVQRVRNLDIHLADSANDLNTKSLETMVGSVSTPTVFINGIYQPNALSKDFLDEIVNNNVPDNALLSDGALAESLLKKSVAKR